MMLKVLALILAAIVAPVQKPFYSYELRPKHIEQGAFGLPSCGGAKRFVKEKWKVKVWDYDHVTVNGMRWAVSSTTWDDGPPLGHVTLTYRAEPDAFTYLELNLYTNRDGAQGIMMLYGRLPNRDECYDVVHIEGAAK